MSKKLRKDTEFAVRRWASGEDSGLESAVVDQLRLWDDLFDTEIHGARLSMALALAADPEESGGMPVLPTYGEKAHAMFMNRHCEIGWTTPGCPFAPEWREKWSILDECFKVSVEALTAQFGKQIGSAVSAFVETKFPYSADSSFSLEGDV